MQISESQLAVARDFGEALFRFIAAIKAGGSQQRQSHPAKEPPRGKATASLAESDQLLLTAAVVGRLLALSRSKVYGLMESGELPYIKLGKSRRIRKQDVLKLIQDNEKKRS